LNSFEQTEWHKSQHKPFSRINGSDTFKLASEIVEQYYSVASSTAHGVSHFEQFFKVSKQLRHFSAFQGSFYKPVN
jgi:hypothetical protein